jgi:hypothetical protein
VQVSPFYYNKLQHSIDCLLSVGKLFYVVLVMNLPNWSLLIWRNKNYCFIAFDGWISFTSSHSNWFTRRYCSYTRILRQKQSQVFHEFLNSSRVTCWLIFETATFIFTVERCFSAKSNQITTHLWRLCSQQPLLVDCKYWVTGLICWIGGKF